MSDGGADPYRAYLLRLWPVDANGRTYWRASLQNVSTGERQGFEHVEALFAFLREETRPEDERPGER